MHRPAARLVVALAVAALVGLLLLPVQGVSSCAVGDDPSGCTSSTSTLGGYGPPLGAVGGWVATTSAAVIGWRGLTRTGRELRAVGRRRPRAGR